jgi:hypothetical protein
MTMKASINRQLFSQINIDSGSLTMLTTVVHRFSEPGEYEGVVIGGLNGADGRGGIITRRFTIVVIKDSPDVGTPATSQTSSDTVRATASPMSQTGMQPSSSITQPGQVMIDLTGIAYDRFVLNSGGYAVFYVSGRRGGYTVQVSNIGKGKNQTKVFDSRELKEDDVLSVIVIRPGTYSVMNPVNDTKAELVVNYPELGKMQKNPQPITIECTSNQIVPDRIRIDPSQGLVFNFKTPSRIKIELIKPEDRPSRLRKERILAREKILGLEKGDKKIYRRYRLVPNTSK